MVNTMLNPQIPIDFGWVSQIQAFDSTSATGWLPGIATCRNARAVHLRMVCYPIPRYNPYVDISYINKYILGMWMTPFFWSCWPTKWANHGHLGFQAPKQRYVIHKYINMYIHTCIYIYTNILFITVHVYHITLLHHLNLFRPKKTGDHFLTQKNPLLSSEALVNHGLPGIIVIRHGQLRETLRAPPGLEHLPTRDGRNGGPMVISCHFTDI